MTGPKDPAGASGGRLRASHADREQAVETLKDAFVRDRLTRDEFGARMGRALVARSRAELAALTADVPSSPDAAPSALPVPLRPRRPLVRAAAGSGACLAFAFALVLFAANVLDSDGLGNPYHPWSALCGFAAFIAVIAAAIIALMGVATSLEQRRTGR